uniref:Synaptobrevin, longin-like domain protein n=1 Tax=Tanacetum cinerariifolium TaxID=118510 RepID=A0A6L2K6F1_TANCI|nr:synaptobrevin, longin-like domain protein [Tanacetum cinerariifolium]
MVAILEKTDHNTDFHQIVDFLEASHIRYALTISPTVYVSHIRQFWSTARIEIKNQETKIIATVDGKPQTISESSLKRHLKLNDEEGISSLPDTELFENLSLMGYNILPNQRFTFQKGQFSHQWKFFIPTIMQCLSPKRTGFNEFSSNIATAIFCLATNRVYNFSKMILKGKGSANPTEPHHTPLSQEHHSPQHDSPSPSHQTITFKPIPLAPTVALTLRKYTRRAIRIAQSKALSAVADEPASLSRDDRQREAFPTVSSLDAGQDRENIAKTSALPHESSPRVPSDDVDEGSMQQRIHELMDLCTSLQRQQSQMAAKIKYQDLEISELKARMINVLSSMEAANILSSRGAAVSVSSADVLPTTGVPTVSGSFPTVSPIFTTTSMVTPYTRRSGGITIGSSQPMRSLIIRAKDKGKEKVIEAELTRDSEIARLHAEEELKIMIEGLDRSNEVITKHLSEYEQAEADLSVREKIELINQGSSKRMKISKGVSEEELKGMMQIVPLEKVYIKALQQFDREDLHQLWTLVKETFSIKQAIRDKEKELWVELKRLFEPKFEDQVWTHHQAFMHDPLDWKLYNTCGVHHVSTKDQEIFMLVEKDYPLRKGLATMMISNKLQVEQYSQTASDLILKIHSIANSPR